MDRLTSQDLMVLRDAANALSAIEVSAPVFVMLVTGAGIALFFMGYMIGRRH